MPVFSPPPLKFRTVGFPQYGFKREFSHDIRRNAVKTWPLTSGQSLVRLPPMMDLAVKTPPQGEAEEEAPKDNPVQRSLARHRVMLSRRVIAYYDLMCASHLHSATYGFAVEPSNPVGREARGSTIYNRCVCSYVPFLKPRWTGRLHLAVTSPTVIALANSFVARHPHNHAHWFSRGSCNEANRFTCVAARTIVSPHQQGTFTVELSSGGSPQPDVDYDYAGKQPIPAAGLPPARHTSVRAAKGKQEPRKREVRALPNFLPSSSIASWRPPDSAE